jgi:hypothetical protein
MEQKKASPKKAVAKKAAVKKEPAAKKPAKKKEVIAPIAKKDDILASLKRTLIPILVGMIGASFAGPYIDQATLRDFLAGLIAAVYYTVIRFAETKVPQAGILLGEARQPEYK